MTTYMMYLTVISNQQQQPTRDEDTQTKSNNLQQRRVDVVWGGDAVFWAEAPRVTKNHQRATGGHWRQWVLLREIQKQTHFISHHDRQDTFIGEALQPFTNRDNASNHTEGHRNHKDVVGGDAISDECSKHEDHDEAHEDQLPPLGLWLFVFGKKAHARSKRVHRLGCIVY